MPRSWNDLQASSRGRSYRDAGEAYRAQPAIAAAMKQKLESWNVYPVDHFGSDMAAFCDRICLQTLVPYAVVKDGHWFEQGRMSGMEIGSGEICEKAWGTLLQEMYAEASDDTLLTVVDCHT